MRCIPSHRAANGSLLCRLEMITAEASTQLCTCVFDCNVPLLRRYIKAGILVNAGNFDSRTALHVAAAEGNLAAVRLRCETALMLFSLKLLAMPCYKCRMYVSVFLNRDVTGGALQPQLFCIGAGAGGGREG